MDVVCIDEIGPLELSGDGWAPATRELLKHLDAPLILVVRSSLLDQLSSFLGRDPEAFWHPSTTTDREAFDRLRTLQP
jgi:nucleoside-triphosphatase THEP1